MALRTSGFFIISAFFLCTCLQAQKKNDANSTPIPLFNGITVGVDLYGLGASMLGSDFISSELSIDVNLKNRFFPIVEIGYGKTDTWSDDGTNYKSSAPYFRIGMNYNTMYKKGSENYLYVGLRYGRSSFNFDIHTAQVDDPIWGNSDLVVGRDQIWGGTVAYPGYDGIKGSMQWYEFILGVQAKITGNLYMGWALRMQQKISGSGSDYADPWYVPGYGAFNSSKIGITYSVMYKLPFFR